MKMKFTIVGTLLAVFLVFASVNIVQAQWAAIKQSGYAVTTNWHGKDVIIGQPVTATAGTTNPDVPPNTPILTVEFKWRAPAPNDEPPRRDVTFPIVGPIYCPALPGPGPIPQEIVDWATDPANAGKAYWYAQDTFVPDVLGDWGVQVTFADTVYKHHQWEQFTVKRATSFEVVPEVPFGTIAIVLSWCGILGVFALRRRHLIG